MFGPVAKAASIFGSTGYAGVVSKPTTFVAGEGNEDEFVSIIPKSQMAQGVHAFTPGAAAGPSAASAGGGGGGDTYHIGPFIAQGTEDSTAFMKHCLDFILRETRGRGQITVKSASIH